MLILILLIGIFLFWIFCVFFFQFHHSIFYWLRIEFRGIFKWGASGLITWINGFWKIMWLDIFYYYYYLLIFFLISSIHIGFFSTMGFVVFFIFFSTGLYWSHDLSCKSGGLTRVGLTFFMGLLLKKKGILILFWILFFIKKIIVCPCNIAWINI